MSGLRVKALVGGSGSTRLDVDLDIDAGSVVAVIGPNGSGKTTLLKTAAGLVDPGPAGEVSVAGRDVTRLAPGSRRVAYVPQQGALFPHLSVLDNVAYGPRAAGMRRSAARIEAAHQLRRLDIEDLAARRPATLSGGQIQRVALCRALAINPDVILLDEPTASLDAVGRADVQSLLRRHLHDFAGVTLLVTHDPTEALTVAARVVVLAQGRVVQDARPDMLAKEPGSQWLAQLLNLNAWTGQTTDTGAITLDEGGTLTVPESGLPGRSVLVCTAPTSVTLFDTAPSTSARNTWSAEVVGTQTLGGRVRVTLRAIGPQQGPMQVVAEVTTAVVNDLGITPGMQLWASVKATDLAVSPV
ncbi:MAG: ATP-binding cassette domain-containing protein [Actinomycetia bacterium]|nr:ATP-binding cassette domain-containing protein [Actinomycetes bacterium]